MLIPRYTCIISLLIGILLLINYQFFNYDGLFKLEWHIRSLRCLERAQRSVTYVHPYRICYLIKIIPETSDC